MPYLAPVNAFEFDWKRVSNEDQRVLIELLREKEVTAEADFEPDKVWISHNDSSYYILPTQDDDAPMTFNFTLQSVTAKQRELGII